MDRRFGVSVSHYGGASWHMAELENELARRGIPILNIRGCAYPEMARAEQVRQARIANVGTLVLLDPHVDASVEALVELVETAEESGVALTNDVGSPWALECAAIRLDVIDAMVRREERTYVNCAVDAAWGGEKVPAVPLANPWHRNGESLSPGAYLSDSEAFLLRAQRAGANVIQHWPTHPVASHRKRMRARVTPGTVEGQIGSHFALCIPTYGALDHDQQASVFALEKAGMMVCRLHDCPWIDQARGWLAEQALAAGRGVFFLDHDIVFQPNDVLRLCEQALERDAVVAGAYCMRRSGKNVIGAFDLPPGPLTFFEGGDTHPAHYSGLGFAAIPKSVLLAIERPSLVSQALSMGLGTPTRIRPWFALDVSTGFYAGEDVSFCNRVHDLSVQMLPAEPGFESEWRLTHSGRRARVFLDSRVRIFHRGSYDYGIEDAGIVVPRIESMQSLMTESRKEARAILINALELPTEVKLDMQDWAQP
jgi:hypothetical protein